MDSNGDIGMDLVELVEQAKRDIIQRATLIELRDAIRIADKIGDSKTVQMFKDEVSRRLSDERE
jgi:hypothetical protein